MKNLSTDEISWSGKGSNTSIIALIVSASATFLLAVAKGLSAIIIPTTLQNNGTSNTLIGLIMSFETIASILISCLLPMLLHLISMTTGFILSTILRIPSLLLLAYSSNPFIWAFAVFLNGVGCFSFLILLQTWIVGLKFKSNRGLMVALNSTALTLGLAMGPLLLKYYGNLVPQITAYIKDLLIEQPFTHEVISHGISTRFYFILIAFISLSALLPIVTGFKLIPSVKFKGSGGIWKSIMHAKGPMFAIAMAGASFFGVSAFITLYGLKNQLTLQDSALLLTCFMMGSLLLEAPMTWVSDYIDRRYIIVIAAFLSMLCAVYLPIAIYVNYQAFVLLFIWGGVIGSIYSTSLALIGEKFRDDDLVAANAGYSLMEAAGGTLSILLIGYTMDAFGSDGLSYVIMLSSIVYFSFALTRYRVV